MTLGRGALSTWMCKVGWCECHVVHGNVRQCRVMLLPRGCNIRGCKLVSECQMLHGRKKRQRKKNSGKKNVKKMWENVTLKERRCWSFDASRRGGVCELVGIVVLRIGVFSVFVFCSIFFVFFSKIFSAYESVFGSYMTSFSLECLEKPRKKFWGRFSGLSKNHTGNSRCSCYE